MTRLHRETAHLPQRGARQRSKAPVLVHRGFRHAHVGDEHRNRTRAALVKNIRPQLGLHDDRDHGTRAVEKALDRRGVIVGHVAMRHLAIEERIHPAPKLRAVMLWRKGLNDE